MGTSTFTPILVDFSNPALTNIIAGANGSLLPISEALTFLGVWADTLQYYPNNTVYWPLAQADTMWVAITQPTIGVAPANEIDNPWLPLSLPGTVTFPDITDNIGVSVGIAVPTTIQGTGATQNYALALQHGGLSISDTAGPTVYIWKNGTINTLGPIFCLNTGNFNTIALSPGGAGIVDFNINSSSQSTCGIVPTGTTPTNLGTSLLPITNGFISNLNYTTINTFSDRKLKENESVLTQEESLNLISKLEPKKFSWKKDETSRMVTGFIAQDLLKNGLEQVVLVEEDFLRIRADAFTAPLVSAVQYLIEEQKQQQREIEILKGFIEDLLLKVS